jgi:phospholipid-binding lipoprotein MlaA
LARWLVFAALGTILAGCGTLAGPLRVDSGPVATPTVHTTASEPGPGAGVTFVAAPVERDASATIADAATPAVIDDAEAAIAAAGVAALEAPVEPTSPAVIETQDTWMAQARENGDVIEDQYDPWEPFNERMFEVNRRLDRYFLKPVAKAYNFITPDELQIMISNGFDNISFPPRFVNSLLQGKLKGATREIGRFLINSTLGVGGLFDPAKDVFGLVKSREDFGQTLGFYGVGPGPFLIVPLMEPMTVRDGIGKVVDGAMDPLVYYLPFFWDRLGMRLGDIINERSLNLDLFQGFEESVIDLYSAVRHGYLQRREKLIRE